MCSLPLRVFHQLRLDLNQPKIIFSGLDTSVTSSGTFGATFNQCIYLQRRLPENGANATIGDLPPPVAQLALFR